MSVVYPDFRRPTCHIPRRNRIDWLCLIVWASMPIVSALFYYWLWKVI